MAGQPLQALPAGADERILLDLPYLAADQDLVGTDAGRRLHLTPQIGTDGPGRGIADQEDVELADPVVDHPAPLERRERPGPGKAIDPDREHLVLGGQALVFDQSREHQPRAREIVAVRAAGGVVPLIAGVERKHPGLRMLGPPALPARDHHRAKGELDAGAGERPDHGAAGELVPEASGRLVVHQLVGAVEKARGAEDEGLVPALDRGLEQDAGAAERAIGKAHRHATDDVVEHLVPVHDAERIGPGIAVDGDAEDRLLRRQIVGLGGRDMGGIGQRRDAVLLDPAPDDLLEADVMGDAGVEEFPEIRIDQGHDVGQEAIEAGKGGDLRMRLLPEHPLPPVFARRLARELRDRGVDGAVLGHEAEHRDQPRDRRRIAPLEQGVERVFPDVRIAGEHLCDRLAEQSCQVPSLLRRKPGPGCEAEKQGWKKQEQPAHGGHRETLRVKRRDRCIGAEQHACRRAPKSKLRDEPAIARHAVPTRLEMPVLAAALALTAIH
jgi:hypothetical protein